MKNSDYGKMCAFQMRIYFSCHDFLVDLNRLVGVKWRISGRHFIDKNSKRPPIDRLVIALESNKWVKKLWKEDNPIDIKLRH